MSHAHSTFILPKYKTTKRVNVKLLHHRFPCSEFVLVLIKHLPESPYNNTSLFQILTFPGIFNKTTWNAPNITYTFVISSGRQKMLRRNSKSPESIYSFLYPCPPGHLAQKATDHYTPLQVSCVTARRDDWMARFPFLAFGNVKMFFETFIVESSMFWMTIHIYTCSMCH